MPISTIPHFHAPYEQLVAAGDIPGTTGVNKFGGSSSIADGTTEEIWDGAVVYAWPTTAEITHIRTAADTPAMDGLDVEIQGLDTDWGLVVQTATIDAATSTVTEVELTTPLKRVFRMKVTDSVVTTNDIWVGATGMAAATAKGIIQTGNNQTLMAMYTIPAGKTGYMTKYYGSIIGEAGPPATIPDYVRFRLWNRDNVNGYAPQLKHEIGAAINGTSAIPPHNFAPYLKLTEKTDVWLTGTPDGDDAYVSAGFDIFLVDN